MSYAYDVIVIGSERGIREGIFSALAGEEDAPGRLFIDSSRIKVHRCAAVQKEALANGIGRTKGAATPSSTLSATTGAAPPSCS